MNYPTTTIGSGSPHIAVLSGVHGNERSSVLVQHALVNEGWDEGTLHLIGPVNEAAWKNGTRYIEQDLNRAYPQPRQDTYEGKIASRLVDQLKDMDVVIDLHTYRMSAQTTVIDPNNSKLVQSFNPPLIWHMDLEADHNEEYNHTLFIMLEYNGVKNLVVELPPVEEITRQDVMQCVKGIRRVAENKVPETSPPRYTRHKYDSPGSGVFVPHHDIMTPVKKDDVVGEIVMTANTSINIRAEQSAVLLQRHHQGWIQEGDTAFALGYKIE